MGKWWVGSIDAMILEAPNIVDLHHQLVDITIYDYRNPDDKRGKINGDNTLSYHDQHYPCQIGRWHRNSAAWLSSNVPIILCVQMDADDIYTPGRFLAQMHTQKNNLSLDVLVTSSVFFSTCTGDRGISTKKYTSLLPYLSTDQASYNPSHDIFSTVPYPTPDIGLLSH